MSKYTITLREIANIYGENEVKSWFSSYTLTNYLTSEEINIIETRGTWSKERLANKIYNAYLMREIGFETPYLFRHYTLGKMEAIMEKYLPLIYSASIEYNPLVNVDYTETYSRNINDTANNTTDTNSNASGLTINSNTPQGNINKQDILNGNYASTTQGGESTNNDTSTFEGKTSSEESSTKNIKGNSGVSATAQKMIQQYRDNIITIDNDIIKELNTLFIGLY